MTEQQLMIFQEHQEWAEQLALNLHKKQGDMNGCACEDYRQLALLGLLQVIPHYRRSSGKSFEAFAYKRVKGFIRDEIRKLDEVGRSQRDKGQKGPVVSLDAAAHGLRDDGRLLLIRDTLESPRRSDRVAAFDALSSILFGLDATSRAIVYLMRGDDLSASQVTSVLGLSELEVDELYRRAMLFLGRQVTKLQKTKATGPVMEQLGLFISQRSQQ